METYLYKSSLNGNYNLCMAYPAKEDFALSSLGYMWLFKIADSLDFVKASRISTDKFNINLQQTDSISFSLSFDFDYLGVLEILDKNRIPYYSNERGENAPIIFAGGPVITTNPEPYSKFFDFMIIGDGESTFVKTLDILKQKKDKMSTLKELAGIEGIYVPGITQQVKKATAELNKVIYTPVLSKNSYFKDTFIVEIQRGCMNRCAFCTASYINLPFRSYSYEEIIKAIELGLKYTDKIALLGAQISGHPNFNDIMQYLRDKIKNGKPLELGISSLRTDSITPNLVNTLVLGGQRTFTIAIEAASERLRKVINKNLTQEQILNAVRVCRENGLKGLKIYSMIGIPTEENNDIEEFINLAKILKNENKGFNLTFSFSTFVPKPQTPFQWCAREDSKSLEKKQKYLEKNLAILGIESKFSSIKWDYWQTMLSRGDSTLSDLMIYVYNRGGKNSAYKSAIKEFNINIGKFINGYEYTDKLPWDFIENYVSKDRLKNEYNRLIAK